MGQRGCEKTLSSGVSLDHLQVAQLNLFAYHASHADINAAARRSLLLFHVAPISLRLLMFFWCC